MAIVDRHRLPLSVSTHAGNHHEVRVVQLCFEFYMLENLIGDRAYDSDPSDEELSGRHRNDRAAPLKSSSSPASLSYSARPNQSARPHGLQLRHAAQDPQGPDAI